MFCQTSLTSSPSQKDTVKKIASYLFRYTDKLGSGNFSTVYSGVDENTGRQVAVKVVKVSSLKSKVALRLLESEISILKDLDHPNVIKCYDELTSVNNCYIITELCSGDLDIQLQKRGKFQEKEISRWIFDILRGLQYLEKSGIVHRDLKVSNIFIGANNGTAKIADFGFAIKAKNKFKDLSIGSPIYMSPEGLILNQYGPKTDVWSLGVMIYQLLHGECPLSHCKTEQELKKKVLEPPVFRVKMSVELRKFLQGCLKVNQFQRSSVSQLLETLYIKKIASELESSKIYKPYTSGYSSTYNSTNQFSSSSQVSRFHFQVDIGYDTAIAFLHYCRLMHKTSVIVKSRKISQWLINLSQELTKVSIKKNSADKEQMIKLKEVIQEYNKKYKSQHKNMQLQIHLSEVISECQGLISLHQQARSHLQMLIQQSALLKKSLQEQLESFGRLSQSKSYLEMTKPEQQVKQKLTK